MKNSTWYDDVFSVINGERKSSSELN